MTASTHSTPTVRTLSIRQLLIPLALWAAALFGVLQVRHWEGLLGHAICGPWGCGPPVSALVAYQGFWFVLILPVVVVAKRLIGSAAARNWGLGLVLISIAGILGLLLLEGLNNSRAEQYPLQWCGFRIATLIDLPLVQLGLAGVWLRWTWQSAASCDVADVQK